MNKPIGVVIDRVPLSCFAGWGYGFDDGVQPTCAHQLDPWPVLTGFQDLQD